MTLIILLLQLIAGPSIVLGLWTPSRTTSLSFISGPKHGRTDFFNSSCTSSSSSHTIDARNTVLNLVGGGGEELDGDFLERRKKEVAELHTLFQKSLMDAPEHIVTAIREAVGMAAHSHSDTDQIVQITGAVCQMYEEIYTDEDSFGLKKPSTPLDWLVIEVIFVYSLLPEHLKGLRLLAGLEAADTNTTRLIERMFEEEEMGFFLDEPEEVLQRRLVQFSHFIPCIQELIAVTVGMPGSTDYATIVRKAYEADTLRDFHSWFDLASSTPNLNVDSFGDQLPFVMDVSIAELKGGREGNAIHIISTLVRRLKEEAVVLLTDNGTKIILCGRESWRTSKCQVRFFAGVVVSGFPTDVQHELKCMYGLEEWENGFVLIQKIMEEEGAVNLMEGDRIVFSAPGSQKTIQAFLVQKTSD